MKSLFFFKYNLLILLFLLLTLGSCDKQQEQMDNRDKIIGQWDVVENKASANPASAEIRNIEQAYIVNITRSETFPDEAYIYNFFNIAYDFFVPAHVDGSTITIDKLELRDHTFRGSGSISEDHQTIEWTYWVEGPYDDSEIEYRATYSFRK